MYNDAAFEPAHGKKTRTESPIPAGVRIRGAIQPGYERILTREALEFIADLERKFHSRVKYILACRKEEQARYDSGELPGFEPATKAIREGAWTCTGPPAAIADRRVEITGPVERKMIINALNSGAKMFMVSHSCSFEDFCDARPDDRQLGACFILGSITVRIVKKLGMKPTAKLNGLQKRLSLNLPPYWQDISLLFI